MYLLTPNERLQINGGVSVERYTAGMTAMAVTTFVTSYIYFDHVGLALFLTAGSPFVTFPLLAMTDNRLIIRR